MNILLKNRYLIKEIKRRPSVMFWDLLNEGDEIEVVFDLSTVDSPSPTVEIYNLTQEFSIVNYASQLKNLTQNIIMEPILNTTGLSVNLEVVEVFRKTSAKFFKDLEVGDTFEVIYNFTGGYGSAPNLEIHQDGKRKVHTRGTDVVTRLSMLKLKEV